MISITGILFALFHHIVNSKQEFRHILMIKTLLQMHLIHY